jgi:protoporphyrinogen oxidase
MKAVIIGAGITGLTAAGKLSEKGWDVTVLEKSKAIGGVSGTFKHGDYRLDFGPHKIFTQDDSIMAEVTSMMGPRLLDVEKRSRIMLKGKYLDFPLRMVELMLKMGITFPIRGMFDYGISTLKRMTSKKEPTSYEEFLTERFGRTIFKDIFGSYADKLWGDPKTLSVELARSRVSASSLVDVIVHIIKGGRGDKSISADVFHYPKEGIAELSEAMAEKIKKNGGRVMLNTEATRINISECKAVGVNGRTPQGDEAFECDVVISTSDVIDLLGFMGTKAPAEVTDACKGLMHRNLTLVYLAVKRDRLFRDNWLFYPEREYVFNRIYEQKGFSESMIPKGVTVVCAEVTKRDGLSEQELISRVKSDLIRAKVLEKEDTVLESFTVGVPRAYPVYDIGFAQRREKVMAYLDSIPNIYSIGRQGYFNYVGMMDCLDMGKRTSQHIASGADRKDWPNIRKSFESYVTVD